MRWTKLAKCKPPKCERVLIRYADEHEVHYATAWYDVGLWWTSSTHALDRIYDNVTHWAKIDPPTAEAGCPVHDADEDFDLWAQKSNPNCLHYLQPEPFEPLDDDSSGIEISGVCTRRGNACIQCSLVQCRANPDHREWIGKNRMRSAATLGVTKAFGIDVKRAAIDELRATEQHRIIEQKSECVELIWNIRGTLYLIQQCPCCGEVRRTKTIRVNCNEPALDVDHAVKVVEQRILDAHESVIGNVIKEQSIKWVVGPVVSLAGIR